MHVVLQIPNESNTLYSASLNKAAPAGCFFQFLNVDGFVTFWRIKEKQFKVFSHSGKS